MRDKVLAVIEAYSAGGTIEKALAEVGISKTPFRRVLRQDPEVLALYEGAMRARSYVFQDDAFAVADAMGTDDGLDPANARVKAEILLKLSGAANPDRFGQRTNVQIEAKPSIAAAIAAGKERAALPMRDPAPVIDTTYSEITNTYETTASDKQSDAAPQQPGAIEIDPFEP